MFLRATENFVAYLPIPAIYLWFSTTVLSRVDWFKWNVG